MPATKYDNILVQRALNEILGTDLKADGAIGPASLKVITQYQSTNGLPQSGQLDDATRAHLAGYIQQRFVTVDQVAEAATEFGVQPAALLAFWEVESRGAGFLNDGRTIILFEGHKFYEYVAERLSLKQAKNWAKDYPDLCYPEWDRSKYTDGVGEWDRLTRASQLDGTCALLSASWGLFQIMGFNYAMAGFQDVQSMVASFAENERNQLLGVCRYINARPTLMNALKARNWPTVARIYNGLGYALNKYDVKLKAAYDTWSRSYK